MKYIYALCAILLMSLSSCLKDGDYTIPLEEGNTKDMVLGIWQVSECKLFDGEDYAAVIDDEDLLGQTFVINNNGKGSIIDGDTETEMTWTADAAQNLLDINGVQYEIVSLGKNLMILKPLSETGSEVKHYFLVKKESIPAEEENEDNTNVGEGTDVEVIGSDESGTISNGGYTLYVPQGSVPANSQGESGRVSFSLQGVDTNELPVAFNGEVISAIKIEPMGFTFNSPLLLEVPLGDCNPNEVGVYCFDEATNAWILIPFSCIDGNKATVSLISLGNFIVAKIPNQDEVGGIKISNDFIEPGYYYYATLISKNSSEIVKRIGFIGNEGNLYMTNIPFGQYTLYVSREQKNDALGQSASVQYSNQSVNVSVEKKLIQWEGGFDAYENWTEPELNYEKFNDWQDGRLEKWGEVTKTYGTGKFQATLTWVNATSSTYTDYDLHLTLPDRTEVYFDHKKSGAFELDRDWISDIGNAVENIYSISDDFAAGTYTVRVHHYDGALNKRYNCRVIVDGVVVKSVTGSIGANGQFDKIYTFTVN